MSARLFRGGTVITMESVGGEPAALATLGGRILAVGSETVCRRALADAGGSGVEEVDLAGGALLPGFLDTHLHPVPIVVFDLHPDLRAARNLDEVVALLRAALPRLGADDWVLGLQLDDEGLREKRLPTRHDLDRVSDVRPVVVMERDGHCAIGNTPALQAAGLGRETADPPGGRIDREPDGTPAGPCREAAAQQLLGAMQTPGFTRLKEAARRVFQRIASHGVTSAGVVLQSDEEGPAGAAGSREVAVAPSLLAEAPFCTYAIVVGRTAAAAADVLRSPLHDPAAGRRAGAFKIFADGTFGSHTACMHRPFEDAPEQEGMLVHPEGELYERMRDAHRRGLQVCVHAIGDRALSRCLDLFERLLVEHPRPDARHRIEHASLVVPEEARRMARLGIAVSTQPLFLRSERGWLRKRLGPERAHHVYPLRTLLDAGVRVGGASDAPVESTSVLHAIECCVTRDGFEPDQRIGVEEALRMFTSEAAWIQFEEGEKGTLAPGKRADLVHLSEDPRRCAEDRIHAVEVLRTVVGGRDVYRREAPVWPVE